MIFNGNNQNYNLETKPLATGGEGSVYRIVGNNNLIAKIYKTPTKELENKLTYMSNHKPSNQILNDIAWPLDILYDNQRKFVGFIMPKMETNKELGELYKYNPGTTPILDYQQRVIVAINICKVIHAVHEAGYVFGDFNPANIGVNLNTGHVGFFDTDSYHIYDKGNNKMYRCGVCLNGYVAPELIKQCKGTNFLNAPLPTFTQETDRFALAIHIFKLLMNGYTPFNGIKDNERVSAASPGIGNQAIERDNYCFKPGSKPQSVATPELSAFPQSIQDLFTRAFIEGRKNPQRRPSASEWESALTLYLSHEMVQCSKNPYHHFYRGAKCCPYCEADNRFNKLNNTNTSPGYSQINFGSSSSSSNNSTGYSYQSTSTTSSPKSSNSKSSTYNNVTNTNSNSTNNATSYRKSKKTSFLWALSLVGVLVLLIIVGIKNSHNCEEEGHVYGEWIVDTEATCSTFGLQHRDCKYCKDHQEEIIDALNHQNYEWVIIKEPKCNIKGQKQKICQECGMVIETQTIAAPGHTYVSGVCSVCGYKENACAKGHKSSDWIIDWDATCTFEGQKHTECTICGETIKVEKIALLNHTLSDWVVDKEPSCIETGTKHRECTVCHTVETISIDMIDHVVGDWIIDKEVSCFEDGLMHKHCSVCNQDINSTVISATGHTYVNYECTICHDKIDTTGWSQGLKIVNGVIKGIGTCKDTNIVIPSYMADGTKVTSIEDSAFIERYSLTSVSIPNSVTSIGDWAFQGCRSLTFITMPNSVTSIGDLAFNNCESLKSITIPDSVTSIGYGAFSYCRSLISITISDSVKRIEDSTFVCCKNLTSITIPNSVTYIGKFAFSGCNSLTSITISDSVTDINDQAFYECWSLTSITIPNSVTNIGSYVFKSLNCNITYQGTVAEWNEIRKSFAWHYDFDYCIVCTDGTITP